MILGAGPIVIGQVRRVEGKRRREKIESEGKPPTSTSAP
jgi:hypothetical protein